VVVSGIAKVAIEEEEQDLFTAPLFCAWMFFIANVEIECKIW
jgi:hypothetical protein